LLQCVLQCGLQRFATLCHVLQNVAVRCRRCVPLQVSYVADCCSVLQSVAARRCGLAEILFIQATRHNTLQHTTTHSNTLQLKTCLFKSVGASLFRDSNSPNQSHTPTLILNRHIYTHKNILNTISPHMTHIIYIIQAPTNDVGADALHLIQSENVIMHCICAMHNVMSENVLPIMRCAFGAPRCWSRGATNPVQIRWKSHVSFPLS